MRTRVELQLGAAVSLALLLLASVGATGAGLSP